MISTFSFWKQAASSKVGNVIGSSTTGLWFSSDAGSSWSRVTSNTGNGNLTFNSSSFTGNIGISSSPNTGAWISSNVSNANSWIQGANGISSNIKVNSTSKNLTGNVLYVATSNVQAPMTSPFSYSDKVDMTSKLGIPSSHVVQVKNPYQAQEITSSVDNPNDTVLVFAVSEKDMEGDSARFRFGNKKDGSLTYMQPFPKSLGELEPMTKHAYVMVVPTVTFKVLGKDANSASELRKLYIDSDDNTREQIIAELYGDFDPRLKEIFDDRLAITDKAEKIATMSKDTDLTQKMASEQRQRLFSSVRSILLAESRVRQFHKPFTEQTVRNYRNEK